MTRSIVASRPRPRTPRLPTFVLVANGSLVLAGLVAYWRGWERHVPIGYGGDLPALLATDLFVISASLVGFVIARRWAGSVIAWLLLSLGFTAAAVMFGLFVNAVVAGASATPTLGLHGWLASVAFQPAMGGLTGLLMLTFPDGRLPSRAWRPAVALLLIGVIARFLEAGLLADRVTYLPTLANPFRLVEHAVAVPGSGTLEPGLLALLTAMGLGALSQLFRYRRADADARRQIRGFAFAGTAVAATLLPLAHLFLFVDPAKGVGQHLWVLFFFAASLFPVAVGIAITRYRLYDIDRLVSRTFVYGVTTAIVAGMFTASIGLSQKLFVALTGETSDLAIVLTTLVAASSYTPIRKRLEAFAERSFKYEEPRLGSYGQSLRDVLALLDPEESARRLISEVTVRLRACGGWVELDVAPAESGSTVGGDAAATAGSEPCPASLFAPIPGRAGTLGRLIVGPRVDGLPYRPDDLRVLEEAGRLLGRALELGTMGGATSARPRPDGRSAEGRHVWLRVGEPFPTSSTRQAVAVSLA